MAYFVWQTDILELMTKEKKVIGSFGNICL